VYASEEVLQAELSANDNVPHEKRLSQGLQRRLSDFASTDIDLNIEK
jgi:hypothetical protein